MDSKVEDRLYEKMITADADVVASISMIIMNMLQNYAVSDQLLGMSALMVLMDDKYNIKPSVALGIADNIIKDYDKLKPEFRAIKQYMQEEFKI